MGTHCSSELYRGHILKSKTTTMKLLLLTALAAVAMAEPEAEAGFYGYHPGFYGYYGHQLNWPGVRAPGFSSQCFGCRGKRSAEAEAEPGYGYYGYPAYGFYGYPYFGYRGVATSFEARSPQGLRGKRSAEEAAPAEAATPVYGLGHNSYVGQTVWGFPRSKRSAEPGYYHPYGYYPYHFGYRAYGPGIAGHPTGTSFVARSPQGLGK